MVGTVIRPSCCDLLPISVDSSCDVVTDMVEVESEVGSDDGYNHSKLSWSLPKSVLDSLCLRTSSPQFGGGVAESRYFTVVNSSSKTT